MTTQLDQALVISLAQTFAAFIRTELDENTLRQVNEINAANDYADDTCATGDYCDSNQCMIDAWQKVTGKAVLLIEDIEGNEAKEKEKEIEMSYQEHAWRLAKTNNFYTK